MNSHLAESRPREYHLDDGDAAQEPADGKPQERHERQAGVRQHMTPKDALHGKTARLGTDHIVLSKLFEDSRAHLPRILRRHDDGERERRKHDASRRDVAARNREEVQLQSEDIEQHESDPKARH